MMLEKYYAKTEEVECLSKIFRSEGYVHDGMLPRSESENVRMVDLPPFLRTLVVTDGTVTKSLEAYYWESIRVETISQELISASSNIEWLRVDQGDEVLIREVRLVGVESERIYATAFSVIKHDCIPEDLRRRLLDGKIGIGVLIRDSGLETYREVLEVTVDRVIASSHLSELDEPKVQDSVLRTYRIFMGHEPAILITESFPWELYQGT